MFIYNVLQKSFEITALQGVIVFIPLISSLIIAILLIKKYPSKKIIVISVILGLLLSLFTLVIGNGRESGTGYASKFGWPMYYLENFQTVEAGSMNYNFGTWFLVIERFVLNTSIFIFSLLNIFWFFSLRRSMKSLKIHILPLLTLLAILMLSISCLTNVLQTYENGITNSKLPDDDTEQKLEAKGRYLVETKYPLFKDYEKQTSFAGKEVATKIVGKKIYFAYAENGSGVRYIDATCFSVDESENVTIIGKLIKSTPTVLVYIDPVTCKEKEAEIIPNSN